MSRSQPSWRSRLLRDPLVHFVAAGALTFAVYATLHPDAGASRQIVIGEADLARLRVEAQAQWGRPPDERQLQALVQALLHEEVLVREAQAQGLDRDDPVVRRRLAQKMEFLAQQDVRTPSEADLAAWFAAHAADYQRPATVTFEQRYFGGPGAAARATAALQHLRQGADTPGDRFMLEAPPAPQDAAMLTRDYGGAFTQAVFGLPLAQWSGPIASPHGQHLVRLQARTEPAPATLAAVRERVAADALNRRIADARDAAYAAWLARYQVTLPEGMAPSALTGALPPP